MCQENFSEELDIRTHFHQYHLNPHLLAPEDVKLYRLSNFLVRVHEKTDEIKKTDFRGLYRCHECFNVFDQESCLSTHITTKHLAEGKVKEKMVSESPKKMPTQIDKLSREDFEDASPRMRKSRTQVVKPLKAKQKQRNGVIKKSKAAGRLGKLLKLQSEVPDEIISEDSESGNEAPTSRRPQRECKSRTSTLVAISLAEQEYEQFDLDFERFKLDVNSISDVDLARMKHIEKRVLADRKNVPTEISEEDETGPSDEITLSNRRSLTPVSSEVDSKSSIRKKKFTTKANSRKRIVLTKLPKVEKIVKKRKNRKQFKAPLKEELKSEGEESSTKENDLYDELVDTSATSPERRRSRPRRPEGAWSSMKGAMKEKARQVVQEVLAPPPEFLCLHCQAHFANYITLKSHKKECKQKGTNQPSIEFTNICNDSKDPLVDIHEIKHEALEDRSAELYEYVTGKITYFLIPQLTFSRRLSD